jgi:hypothetical protein
MVEKWPRAKRRAVAVCKIWAAWEMLLAEEVLMMRLRKSGIEQWVYILAKCPVSYFSRKTTKSV